MTPPKRESEESRVRDEQRKIAWNKAPASQSWKYNFELGFPAGWNAALKHSPTVLRLVGAAEMICKYPDSEGCFDELHETLRAYEEAIK